MKDVPDVAPSAGAWIEISIYVCAAIAGNVAPSAGAWIEIICKGLLPIHFTSLPPRERGLKLLEFDLIGGAILVAPSAGAWIEIYLLRLTSVI